MAERIYTINIRKATLKAPRWEKSKRSVAFVREFLKRHMKGDEIRIGKSITEEIWKSGNQNPPAKIRIHVVDREEEDKKVILAELLGVAFAEEKEKKKKEKKKEKEEEKVEEKKTEEKIKTEEKKESKINSEDKTKEKTAILGVVYLVVSWRSVNCSASWLSFISQRENIL